MPDSKKMYSIGEIKLKLTPLFNEKGLQFVLLFGSMASGRASRRSDIDLAFLFDEPADILALTNRVIQLLQTDRVDVIDLRHASPLLSFAGAKEGKLLFERSPGLFNSFCSLAFRRYIDTKKMRDAQEKAIEHFIEEKGLT
jgi:predicted nucleotidyltransferase